MRSLPRPEFSVESVLQMIGSSARADKLRKLEEELKDGEAEFRANALTNDYRLTAKKHPALKPEDEVEVKWAWSARLSGKKGTARPLYDALRGGAPHNRCPLCLHRIVHDLDHFLPQSKYPRLAIVPDNLVPICSDCNGIKRSFVAESPEEEPLHPYFDDLGEAPWLEAEVVETGGAPVLFAVLAQPTWSSTLASRVVTHFERLGLAALYTDLAAGLLADIGLLLERQYAASGSGGVKFLLNEMADSWSRPGNEPYQAAALRAWASSDFVCDGGWKV